MAVRQGMILGAGFGTRLLPITEKQPKPIVPMLNVPGILYNIFLLKKVGIEEIVINLHYIPEAIKSLLGDGQRYGVKLHFSMEETLLGTGGGVKNAQKFLTEPFVLSNSDFVSNIDLASIIKVHNERKAMATMVLIENSRLQPYYSKVGTNSMGHLCQLPSHSYGTPERSGIFTGLHILDPKIFDYLELKFSGINQVLYPQIMKAFPDKVLGVFAEDAEWHDTGELSSFWMTSMRLLKALDDTNFPVKEMLAIHGYRELAKQVWTQEKSLPEGVVCRGPLILGKGCTIGSQSRIGPNAVIGSGAAIEEMSIVEDSVVLPNANVTESDRVRQMIAFESHLLPVAIKE